MSEEEKIIDESEPKWEGKKGVRYWFASSLGDKTYDPSGSKILGAVVIIAFVVGCFVKLSHETLLLMATTGGLLMGVKDWRENT